MKTYYLNGIKDHNGTFRLNFDKDFVTNEPKDFEELKEYFLKDAMELPTWFWRTSVKQYAYLQSRVYE